MDQVKDNKNSDELWAENLTIIQSMKKLNNKEREILVRRFFDGRTQMEVAEEIGISQAQVSRIYSSASLAKSNDGKTRINFRGVIGGRSLKLHITGSCIGGNLQRWLDNTETNSLVIDHDPSSAQRLAVSPVTANILRIRTRPVKL